ncbi:unnamed protein product [Pedinophyceae sp. YPF-701]|nr:unnamed protein product [Pedinophyceae sp. YPF-701]
MDQVASPGSGASSIPRKGVLDTLNERLSTTSASWQYRILGKTFLGFCVGGCFGLSEALKQYKRPPKLMRQGSWGAASVVCFYNCVQEAARLARGEDTPLNSAVAGGLTAYMYYRGVAAVPHFAVQAGMVAACACTVGRVAVDSSGIHDWFLRTLVDMEYLDPPPGSDKFEPLMEKWKADQAKKVSDQLKLNAAVTDYEARRKNPYSWLKARPGYDELKGTAMGDWLGLYPKDVEDGEEAAGATDIEQQAPERAREDTVPSRGGGGGKRRSWSVLRWVGL